MKSGKRLMRAFPIALLFMLLVLGGETFAQSGCCPFSGPGPGGMMGSIMGWWSSTGGILMIAFWVLILLGIGRMIQRIGNEGKVVTEQTPSASTSPRDILNKRYAGGEITKEQYESMKRDLG
jgi:putative membrane protein